ncbi:MAG: sugar ABC transporter permease [Clostridia bacterium]|nr:sugar ABC transporter permease [Clostridia bacterium]
MLEAIKPSKKTIFLYLLLPIAAFVFTVFFPLLTAVFYSFFEWKNGPTKTFNGITNYVQLFGDATFWKAFGNNIYLVVACLIGQIGIAFILVLLVNSKLAVAKSIHRTFGFFPSTISAVCLGMIWSMVYHNQYGILNWFLRTIGRPDLCKVWLNDTANIMLYVSIPLIWQYIGYYMVILFSAIAGIDQQIFESAEIDGANAVQTALHITLPMIRNTMLVCLTLCIAGNMKAFDNIYTMTKGGPGTASMVMAMYGYKISFEQFNMGYGSAISVGIFVLSLLVIGGSQFLVKQATKRLED